MTNRLPLVLLLLALGCQTTREAYYNTWEKFGYAKRERMVDNVKAASKAQDEAKQQFASALEQFKSVVNFNGGDLEKMYGKLNSQYDACVSRADKVHSRIASVKNVSTALFSEWKGEIGEMSDPTLKSKSTELLDRTKSSYSKMIGRMDSAAGAMDPVLKGFHDRVLFLKHNLNAQAIGSLKGTELELGSQIDALIKDMEGSMAEADRFIAQLKQ
jgi:hypothetical protein